MADAMLGVWDGFCWYKAFNVRVFTCGFKFWIGVNGY